MGKTSVARAVAAALFLVPMASRARVRLLDADLRAPFGQLAQPAALQLAARLDDGGGGLVSGPGKPVLAVLFSLVPGLGQWLVNDQPGRGLMFFGLVAGLAVSGAILARSPLWFLSWVFELGAFAAWVFNLYDAWVGAGGRKAGGGADEPSGSPAAPEPEPARAPVPIGVVLARF